MTAKRPKHLRDSAAICAGAHKYRVEGNPESGHVSTSFVECQNLNIRVGNCHMTRLTHAFSKKAENDARAIAIYVMHHNFVRICQTLKITPAMATGVTEKLWGNKRWLRIELSSRSCHNKRMTKCDAKCSLRSGL
jgi:hypothetical protein